MDSPTPPPHRMAPARRTGLHRLVTGPLPRLPGPLDLVAEAWWRLPVRVRLVAVAGMAALAVLGLTLRSSTSPWGRATTVVVATRSATPGEHLLATAVTWPADLVPPDALATPPDGVATRPVRAGEVLTGAHVAEDLSHLLAPGEVAMTMPDPPAGLPPAARLELLGTDFQGVGRRLGGARLLDSDDAAMWVAVDAEVAPAVAAALTTGQVSVALAPDQ